MTKSLTKWIFVLIISQLSLMPPVQADPTDVTLANQSQSHTKSSDPNLQADTSTLTANSSVDFVMKENALVSSARFQPLHFYSPVIERLKEFKQEIAIKNAEIDKAKRHPSVRVDLLMKELGETKDSFRQFILENITGHQALIVETVSAIEKVKVEIIEARAQQREAEKAALRAKVDFDEKKEFLRKAIQKQKSAIREFENEITRYKKPALEVATIEQEVSEAQKIYQDAKAFNAIARANLEATKVEEAQGNTLVKKDVKPIRAAFKYFKTVASPQRKDAESNWRKILKRPSTSRNKALRAKARKELYKAIEESTQAEKRVFEYKREKAMTEKVSRYITDRRKVAETIQEKARVALHRAAIQLSVAEVSRERNEAFFESNKAGKILETARANDREISDRLEGLVQRLKTLDRRLDEYQFVLKALNDAYLEKL